MDSLIGFENYGKRQQLARKNAGLSQLELAMRVGTTQATISSYERGDMIMQKPDIRLIVRIADELKVSIAWLIRGHE